MRSHRVFGGFVGIEGGSQGLIGSWGPTVDDTKSCIALRILRYFISSTAAFTARCGGFLHAVDVLLGNIAALSPAP